MTAAERALIEYQKAAYAPKPTPAPVLPAVLWESRPALVGMTKCELDASIYKHNQSVQQRLRENWRMPICEEDISITYYYQKGNT